MHSDNDLGSQRRPRNGKRELSAGAAAGGMKKYTVQGYIDVSVKKKSRIFSCSENMRDFFLCGRPADGRRMDDPMDKSINRDNFCCCQVMNTFAAIKQKRLTALVKNAKLFIVSRKKT